MSLYRWQAPVFSLGTVPHYGAHVFSKLDFCCLSKFRVQDDNDATLNSHLGNGQRKNPRATGSANTTEQNGLASSTSTTVTASTAAFEHRQELELDGLPCLVKVYDFRKGLLKLNDTVEFVGILAYDPPVPSPGDHSSTVAATAEERQGTASIGVSDLYRGLDDFSRKVPPASLAPRLHCICEYELYVSQEGGASYGVFGGHCAVKLQYVKFLEEENRD